MKNDSKIDFVGIGAEKSATTWIYRCLQEHPGIYILPKDNLIGSRFLGDSTEYKHFLSLAQPGQLVGEFNILYLRHIEVLKKIKAENPDVKLIACLRNPITRAYSAYIHHYTLTGKPWIPFRQAIDLLPNEVTEPGFYFKYLKQVFESFDKENVLILIYEDIQRDPVEFIQKIYSFLGADKDFVPSKAKTKVATADFKLTKLGKITHKKITPLLKKSKIGWKINESPVITKWFYKFADFYVGKKKSKEIDKESWEYLANMYKQDIGKLEELIGKRLW